MNTLFSFQIKEDATTSAGIYDKAGYLIRTLWSNVRLKAKRYHYRWDGLNDNGEKVLEANSYAVKVLSNNVRYEWEGVIGNTSKQLSGKAVHRSHDHIYDMVEANGHMYFCAEYSESYLSTAKFKIGTPHEKINVMESKFGIGQATDQLCSDGKLVYMSGRDPWSENQTVNFVYAIHTIDDEQVIFEHGRPYENHAVFQSVIHFKEDRLCKISGIAVQEKGPYLFVSHELLNEIHVLDKSTGKFINKSAVASPKKIKTDNQGNLWVISGDVVCYYAVETDAILKETAKRIDHLVKPLALAISPDNKLLLVADGANSQQLKAFSTEEGELLWIKGQPNGYMQDAAVSDDKFYFSDIRGLELPVFYGRIAKGVDVTYIAFQHDSTYWLGDSGNGRNLHFDQTHKLIDRLMYLPHCFNSGVDKSNSTRVFANYLEFQVDYSKPVNEGWCLIRNWGGQIPANYMVDSGGFTNVVTLKNGKTYAFLYNPHTKQHDLVELTSQHSIRSTGLSFSTAPMKAVFADGSLRYCSNGLIDKKENPITQFCSRPLEGFDEYDNPIWSNEVTILAEIKKTSLDDPLDWYDRGLQMPCLKTTGNIYISFDANVPIHDWGNSAGYHLGGVKHGDDKWLWRTAKATSKTYQGDFPDNGAYDIGNGVAYAGSQAVVLDEHIIWGYHGEFWKNMQANKWTHVYENGLMVGSFGVTGDDTVGSQRVWDQQAAPMMAGNAFYPSLIKVFDHYYLWHNDESFHGGLHRWKISNLNSIKVQDIPF